MRKNLILAYAAVAYVLGLANIAYIVGFLADTFVPKGINDGVPGAARPSIAIDLGLVWLFGLHHSTTARRWFKRHWTRLVSPSIERATYLYMTAFATAVLAVFWQPIPATIWHVESPLFAGVIIAAYLLAFAIMFSATFHLGHLEFFGLAQAWSRFREKEQQPGTFCAKWLYGIIRHPISAGWMIVPWLTPHMTVGQLVFAIGTAIYVLAATIFEEADLIAELGDTYRKYRSDVPAFFPIRRGKSA